MGRREANSDRLLAAGLALLYLGTAAFTFSEWLLEKNRFNTFAPATLEGMLYGGADRPFALRALVPALTRAFVAVVPEASRRAAGRDLVERLPALRRVAEAFALSPEHLAEFAVVAVLMAGALLAFMLALRRLYDRLYEGDRWVAECAPIVATLLLPLLFRSGARFVYDLPVLLFATLALHGLVAGNRLLYYAAVVVGFVNKETMALFAFAFAACHWQRMPRRRLAAHLGAQLALFAVLRLALVALLDPANEPDSQNNYLRNYLAFNLRELWESRATTRPAEVAGLLLFAVGVLRRFGDKPLVLRRSASLFFPLVAAWLWGGRWGEIRVFYEVYPVLFLLFYPNLVAALGAGIAVRPEQDDRRPLLASPGAVAAARAALYAGIAATLALAAWYGLVDALG